MQLVDIYNMENVQSDAVRQCIDFACRNSLQAKAAGRYDIDGDEIYVAISEYQTASSETKAWEAHREYVDLQLVIQGEELVEVSPLSKMSCGEYIPQRDFLPCNGSAEKKVLLRKGVGLILFPEDGHKPGVQNERPQQVKKAVFKIRCSRLVREKSK